MPETMIIYRFFFEWLGKEEGRQAARQILGNDLMYEHSTDAWWDTFQNCQKNLPDEEWQEVLEVIHKNEFEYSINKFTKPEVRKLFAYYINYRKAVVEQGTDLYKLKLEYDKNPTQELKRHGKNKQMN